MTCIQSKVFLVSYFCKLWVNEYGNIIPMYLANISDNMACGIRNEHIDVNESWFCFDSN